MHGADGLPYIHHEKVPHHIQHLIYFYFFGGVKCLTFFFSRQGLSA